MTPETEKNWNDKARTTAQTIFGGSQHTCAYEQFEAFQSGMLKGIELYEAAVKEKINKCRSKVSKDSNTYLSLPKIKKLLSTCNPPTNEKKDNEEAKDS